MVRQALLSYSLTLPANFMASKKRGKIAASAAKRVASKPSSSSKSSSAPNPFGNRTSSAGTAANSAANAKAAIGASKTAQMIAGKAAASRAETLAKGAISSDPKLQQEFQAYQTIWDQLATMAQPEREKLVKDIRDEALAAVDPYYDEVGQYLSLQKEIDTRARELRKNDIQVTAQKQYDRGVEDLTRQAGNTLGDVSNVAFKRNTSDSGVEKSLSDKIIEAKMRGQGRAGEDLEYTKGLAQKEFNLGIEGDALTYRQNIAKLGRQRLYDSSVEESDIFSDLERYNYLNVGEAASIPFYGSNLNKPAPTVTPSGSTLHERIQARADQRLTKSSSPPSSRPSTRPTAQNTVVNLASRRYTLK